MMLWTVTKNTLLSGLLVLELGSVAIAQSVPLPENRGQNQLPPQEVLPPLEELLPDLPKMDPQLPKNPVREIPGSIVVKKFKVVGSTVFTEAQFDEWLKDLTNRPLSFAELLSAQEIITKQYVEQKYITSGAYIPPQTLDNGVVTVQVVEGKIEEINVTGLAHLRPSYIRDRIALATQAPVNQNKLLQALQMLQLNPQVANLSVELAAGLEPGSSILNVKVKEAKAISAFLRTDNQRSPSVGSIRRQIALSDQNLLGWGDQLDFSYINTEGSNALDNLSYTWPINAYNGTLTFRHSRSSSTIIEYPFSLIDIESQSRLNEINWRQPIFQTPTKEIALGLSLSHQKSSTSLLGIPFALSNGANDEGVTKISTFSFFQEYTNRNNKTVLAFRSQFNFGLGLFGATENRDLPDSHFTSWRGQGQYLHLLSPDTTLLLRTDLQFSDRTLVPLEQFSIGGALSVRGYRQDALLADNGLFASAELRTAIAKIPQWNSRIELTPFLDFGRVWNHDSSSSLTRNDLLSTGLGLRWLMGNNFNARIDWGIPLVELKSSGDSLQEQGVYFSMQWNFL